MKLRSWRSANWRYLLMPFALVLCMAALNTWAVRSGWRINLTQSLPLGLYRLTPLADKLPQRGQLVEFCPPEWVSPERFPHYLHGSCASGGMPMLKRVVAVPGDKVVLHAGGISVNGILLPFSQPAVRPDLPVQLGAHQLEVGQYWVFGDGARPEFGRSSFDSRYFGTVSLANIRAMVGS